MTWLLSEIRLVPRGAAPGPASGSFFGSYHPAACLSLSTFLCSSVSGSLILHYGNLDRALDELQLLCPVNTASFIIWNIPLAYLFLLIDANKIQNFCLGQSILQVKWKVRVGNKDLKILDTVSSAMTLVLKHKFVPTWMNYERTIGTLCIFFICLCTILSTANTRWMQTLRSAESSCGGIDPLHTHLPHSTPGGLSRFWYSQANEGKRRHQVQGLWTLLRDFPGGVGCRWVERQIARFELG